LKAVRRARQQHGDFAASFFEEALFLVLAGMASEHEARSRQAGDHDEHREGKGSDD